MIKAIIFDWDGVFTSNFYDKILKVCNDKNKLIDIESKYYDKDNCVGFWEELRKEFKIDYTDKQLEKLINYQIDTDLLNLIPKLKDFRLYLLSNQVKSRTDYIKSNFDLSYFIQTFFSNEIGLKKPSKEIFQYVLDQIKLEPKECLFIDDTQINIKTAKSLGINTIKCKNLNQLKKELILFSINLD